MSKKQRRKLFLDGFCKAFGIEVRDARRGKAANTYDSFGEKQCREWLRTADGDYSKWLQVVSATSKSRKPASKAEARRAAKAEALWAARQAALNRIARFSQPHSGKGVVNTTVNRIDRVTELAILKSQLLKTEGKGDRASEFKRDSLKWRIAFLEAQINSPRI